VVVLDLDECLIHSQFVQGHAGANYAHQVFRSDHDQSPDEKSSSGNFFKISLPDGELVRVHERPYLQEFLQNVSEKYETHIFTASMEVYARPILNALDPHGTIFSSCRFRESCTVDSDMKAYVKNLEFAWGGDQLKRTVLVDNNPLSFMDNPENGILVSNFYNDPNDTTLLTVLDLLEDLESEQDVRPLLDARFGLKQFLKGLRRHQRSRQRRQQEREQGIVAASG
jgi:CTD small phosphatase-like protein 2